MDPLWASLRPFRRRPSEAAAVVFVLALGLAASIAAFTYLRAFSRPFPGAKAPGLVRLVEVTDEEPNQDLSYPDFLDYRAAETPFDLLAAARPYYAASVRLEASADVAQLEAISGDYFRTLGVESHLGRLIAPDDDRPDADPVAVLSASWWRSGFGADPGVLGRTVFLNFEPFTVVGVVADDFLGIDAEFRPDVWIPFARLRERYTSFSDRENDRDAPLVRVYGRLAPGSTLDAAAAAIASVAAALDAAHPRPEERRLRLEKATWIDPADRAAELPTLRLLTLSAVVFLLLACANATNLLLSVALGRERELSLRAAVGASPGHLLRRAVAENVLLSTTAGLVALALAGPLSSRIGSYFARPGLWNTNVARETAVDLPVVLFALALSIGTGLFAALLPALRVVRRDLVEALKPEAVAASVVPWRLRRLHLPGLQELLVSVQIGLAVVLLVVAGLVLRTLDTTRHLDPGFDVEPLVVTHVSTSSTTLEVAERDRFFRELVRRLSDEPWVRAATVSDFPLLQPHREAELRPDGRAEATTIVYSNVLPGYFAALGIGLEEGREFVDRDEAGAPDVAVVNRAWTKRFQPAGSVLGRRIWRAADDGGPERPYEIVGVVADTRTRDLFVAPEPTVYFSYPQHPYPSGSAVLVSVEGDSSAAVTRVERWLREFEPHLAIVHVLSYPEMVSGRLYTQRMNAEMFSGLAALGLALSAIGIFSVVALSVRRRRREIGIRMSVGARQLDIGRLVVGRAMLPVAVGLAVGLAVALAFAGLVRSLLWGVEATDPIAIAGGTVALVATALAAAWFPALRATRIDPSRALRDE